MADAAGGKARAVATAGRYLSFMIGGDTYALPVEDVREVIRPLATVRVPQSPPSLEGLANLRGNVLPVTDARRLLRLDPRERDDATRVIVVDHGAPVGLTVDRLGSLLHVDESRIGDLDVAADLDADTDDGIIIPEADGSEVRIFPARRLLSAEFSSLGRSGREPGRHPVEPAALARPADADKALVLIGFEAAGQEYALPLASVREVLILPDRISTVPHSGGAALGVVTVRDRLLPLVSLRALLGLPAASVAGGRIVVVTLGEAQVGVVADRMGAILRVDPKKVDPVPAALNRAAGDAEIQSICRIDGNRLVSVLAPDRLFRAEIVQRVIAEAGPERSDTVSKTESAGDGVEQFVVFRIDEDEFGVPIDAVDEVMRVPAELTRLPKAPAFVEGIVNIRGSAVPVIDQRRRFDLPTIERDSRQRIIVLRTGGTRVGFIVDTVSEILKIPSALILPAPELTADQFRLISRVAKPDGRDRMVLLIDPIELVDQTEARLLAAMAKPGRARSKT